MSQEIDTALIAAYASNIELGIQQMSSRLQNSVEVESMNAEYEYFDRIEAVAATEITTRHGETQRQDTPHTRRRVQASPWRWSDLIDDQDRLRMLADPTSPYVRNGVAAINRACDDIIIAGLVGTAYEGKQGENAVTLPASQTIPHATTNLTIAKLAETRDKLLSVEAVDDDEPLTLLCTTSQISSLLQTTEVTSADYNTVKTLVSGQINTFYGFNFIRIERLPITTTIRDCIAYPKSALKVGMVKDTTVEVTRMPTLEYSTQVYVRKDMGAARMFEEKVVVIECDET